MGPSEGFIPRSAAELQEKDEQVAEIMKGIPPTPSNPIHFYVDAESDDGAKNMDFSQEDPPTISTFQPS